MRSHGRGTEGEEGQGETPAMKQASEKRDRGRLLTGNARKRFSICLDTEMIKAIDVWARAREIERSSAIRRLVEPGLKAAPAGKGKR